MAIVTGVHNGRNVFIIDGIIRVEHRGGSIMIVDIANGQVMENGGKEGNQLSPTGAGMLLTDSEWATYESTYGDSAPAVAKARHLIDSGKFQIHLDHMAS